MRTKRVSSLVISVSLMPAFLGFLSLPVSGRHQTRAAEQDMTGAAQQQQASPPEQQKVKPRDLEKPKSAKETKLPEYYKKWLEEDVVYIISPEEKNVFKALTTDEERENFINAFWARRDPDPRESGNAFKIEHYRRIAYANQQFDAGFPGWMTDRGRIYILYGAPDSKESRPSGGNYNWNISDEGRSGNSTVYPFERWSYRHIEGVGDNVQLEFVDKTLTGEYKLAMDPNEKDMQSSLAGQVREPNVAGSGDIANPGQTDDPASQQRTLQLSRDDAFERLTRYFNVQRPPQIAFADLKGVVSTRITYTQLPYTMRTDFIRLSQGRVLVPITIELENKDLEFKKELQFNRATVNVYGQVSNLQGRTIAEFEDTILTVYTDESFAAGSTEKSIYQKMVLLDGGQRYRLDLILKDTNSNYVGSMSYGLQIPMFEGEGLQASSVILANTIRPIAPTYDHLDQFVIGDMKVRPNVGCTYAKGQFLIPYLQVYNAAIDQTTLEPSLQISYTIKSGDKVAQDIEDPKGETIQHTSPQRVIIVTAIPIREMALGKYTLEIKVLDKISNKTLVTGTDFQVVAAPSGR